MLANEMAEAKIKDLLGKIWDDLAAYQREGKDDKEDFTEHYLKFYNRDHPTHVVLHLKGHLERGGSWGTLRTVTLKDYERPEKNVVILEACGVRISQKFAEYGLDLKKGHLEVENRIGYVDHLEENDNNEIILVA